MLFRCFKKMDHMSSKNQAEPSQFSLFHKVIEVRPQVLFKIPLLSVNDLGDKQNPRSGNSRPLLQFRNNVIQIRSRLFLIPLVKLGLEVVHFI